MLFCSTTAPTVDLASLGLHITLLYSILPTVLPRALAPQNPPGSLQIPSLCSALVLPCLQVFPPLGVCSYILSSLMCLTCCRLWEDFPSVCGFPKSCPPIQDNTCHSVYNFRLPILEGSQEQACNFLFCLKLSSPLYLIQSSLVGNAYWVKPV